MTLLARRLVPALVLVLAGLLPALPALAQDAPPAAAASTPVPIAPEAPHAAATRDWRIGTSLLGEPKYKAGFTHFDYVNPDAPKGGTVRRDAVGTFDSFNPIIAKGEVAEGILLTYETLMTSSFDEPYSEYGLLADAVSHPSDFSSVTYRLNPAAKWHDGEPVTADDVVWTFQKLKELNPSRAFYYRHVASAAMTGEREVTFTFDQKDNRELPHIVGQLQVLPKHWWTGTDANGRPRDIAETTLEPPLGSGPYKIGAFSTGRDMAYDRVPDYWGRDLPVNVGQNNFDRIAYAYFRDDTVAFEAFKADQLDWRLELRAQRWATGYDFPAAAKGWVVKERFGNDHRSSGQMVGFVPNLRRPLFQDIRLRQALNLAFDFETMQRTLFFGEYQRPNSYFYNSDLASSGTPSPAELAFLDPLKGRIPDSVFTGTYTNPVGGDNARNRENLRAAVMLLRQAGFEQRGGQMVDTRSGQPLSFELLVNGDFLDSVTGQFQQSLKRIGIDMRLRPVDPSQYVNRIRARDYDMIYTGYGQSASPGNEQYEYWGSDAADRQGSQNYAGIRNPAVDTLIGQLVQAQDRDTLVAATRALDRVLLAEQYIIPSYVAIDDRIARWDRFSHPPLPEYRLGWPDIWWYDAAKAAKIPAPR